MMNIFYYLAANKPTVNPSSVGIPSANADTVVNGILNTAYFIAGIAAVIVIIVAGILYSISGGDSAKVAQAKNAIIYAVVGLIVILSAFVITGFIVGRF